MLKSKILKTALLGLCLLTLATPAMAATKPESPDRPVSSDIPDQANPEILEKQKEIDQYLFIDNIDELKQQDFTVTHTSPTMTHVEIGITPYSEEYANYLYDIFGTELVQVVEGNQAYTFFASDTTGEVTTMTTEQDSSSTVYILGALLLLAFGFIALRRAKSRP